MEDAGAVAEPLVSEGVGVVADGGGLLDSVLVEIEGSPSMVVSTSWRRGTDRNERRCSKSIKGKTQPVT